MKLLLCIILLVLNIPLFSADFVTSLSNGMPITLHDDGTYTLEDDSIPYNGTFILTHEGMEEWTEYIKEAAPMPNDIILDTLLKSELVESGQTKIEIHENTLISAGKETRCRVDQQTGILYIRHDNWGYYPSAVFSADFSVLTFFVNSTTGLLSIGGDIPIAFRCTTEK